MTNREDPGPRARAKREQILMGAQRVFLREGFAAASTDVLAQEAGVSKGTLYSYYPGKEELFIDVVRRITIDNPQTQVLESLRRLDPQTTEQLRETLLVLAQKVLNTTMQAEALALLRVIISDARRFPQLTSILRSTTLEVAMLEVSRLLERARANGVPIQAGDMIIMTRLFVGPLMSYEIFDGLLDPEGQPKIPATSQLKTLIDLFLKAILTPR